MDGDKYAIQADEDYLAGKDVCRTCGSLENSRGIIDNLQQLATNKQIKKMCSLCGFESDWETLLEHIKNCK